MSSEQDRIRMIAGRIARQLSESGESKAARGDKEANVVGQLTDLRIELAELHKKLANIETHVTHDETCVENYELRAPQHSEGRREDNQPSKSLLVAEKRMPLSSSTYIPVVARTHAGHPSGERFGVDEAVSELVNFFEREEICKLEPGNKPCDHCAMCSTRGF
ncbi:MAG: hypothetical protein H0T92_10215 [Pyrinomonadaceae bacterium]|nr:hypothetical protein [Pyrinomonadaceae bacterium]